MKTFALALGGGGARGLAHIAVIEALDELGQKPAAIAGTSIGALIGAAYASGMRGRDIRRHVTAFAHNPGETLRRLIQARATGIADLFASFGQAMLIDAEKFCRRFLPDAVPQDFAELAIPLTVVATDLYRRQEVVFSSGPLRRAIAASMALPGLIRPVAIDGRIFIDGGATDPLPFEHLRGRADIVVAVDISGVPAEDRSDMPSTWECLYTTVLVMGSAIVAAKLKNARPDLILRPDLGAFRMLDFYRASAILRAAEPLKAEVKERLGHLLAA
jgi:NTE family protein